MWGERLAIIKSIASYAIANAIKGLSLALLFVVIARNSTTETAGQFGLALAIISPIFALLNVNLRIVVATDQKNEYHFNDYRTLRLVTTIAGAIVSLIVGLFFGYNTGFVMALLVGLIVARVFETNSDICHGIMQKNHRLDLAALSLTLGSFLSLTSVVIALYLTKSVFVSILFYPLGYIIVYFTVDIPNSRRFLNKETAVIDQNSQTWKRLLAIVMLSAPLGIVAALLIYRGNVPRYALNHFMSASEVGIFTGLIVFVPFIQLPLTAASQTLTPRLAKLYADGELRRFVTQQSFLFLIAAILSVVGVVFAYYFGEFALTTLYDQRYAYPRELLIIMIGQVAGNFAGAIGGGLSAMRKFSMQGKLGIAGAVVVTLAAIPLVSTFGLAGACWLVAVDGTTRLVLTTIAYVIFLRRRHEEVSAL